jgi:hypothetical protein
LAAVTIDGKAAVVAMVIWAVFGLCRAISESLIASPRTRIIEDSIDATIGASARASWAFCSAF